MSRADEIKPGDRVEHISRDLDARRVVQVNQFEGWLTLDILGKESPPLPISNYRKVGSS